MWMLAYFIIPIVILVIYQRLKFAAGFVLLASLSCIYLVINQNLPAVAGIVYVFGFFLSAAVAYQFNLQFKFLFAQKDNELKNYKNVIQSVEATNQEIVNINRRLESKVTQTQDLYKITERMSACMDFERLVEVLAVFLQDIFRARGCRLVLAQQEKQSQVNLVIAYKTAERTAKIQVSFEDIEKAAFKLLLKERKVIFLDAKRNSSFGKLTLPAQNSSLAFSPLIFRNKFMGILIVEDADSKNFDPEGLKIIANQLSLELARVLLYQKIQQLAITDGLTGIFVRRHFLERLEEEVKRSKRYNLRLSFLMADIDHFKVCNDSYGHLIGDVVLKEITSVITENIREIDLAGRYGGEEFAVVLPDTSVDDAIQVAERIRRQIEKNIFHAYGEEITSRISIGISVFPTDSSTISGLIKKADQALYQAKNTGRNRICVYQRKT